MEFKSISLGLSLDMLIYTIRYSKPDKEGCGSLSLEVHVYTWVNVNLNFAE